MSGGMYGAGGAGGQAICTDDFSLQVFMEHLKRLVSASHPSFTCVSFWVVDVDGLLFLLFRLSERKRTNWHYMDRRLGLWFCHVSPSRPHIPCCDVMGHAKLYRMRTSPVILLFLYLFFITLFCPRWRCRQRVFWAVQIKNAIFFVFCRFTIVCDGNGMVWIF